MMAKLTFGEWLDDQLRQRRWSQTAFASSLDVARQTVSSWINDVQPPRRRVVKDIARVLGVEIDEVLVRAGYPPQSIGYVLPEEREGEEDEEPIIAGDGLFLAGRINKLSPEAREAIERLIELLEKDDEKGKG